MSKLIFDCEQTDFENREANRIQFDVPNDMDIDEFLLVCKRLAGALGYHSNSIERAFSGKKPIADKYDELYAELINV